MIYIGVDPGKSGAYAVLNEQGIVCRVGLMDTFLSEMLKVHHMLGEGEKLFAVVEQVGAMPKQGVASTFKFGKEAGYVEGVLSARRIPYQTVLPRNWKKEFGLNSDKKKSIEVCRKLFPEVDLVPKGCKKAHDGMAEALLMAEYGRRLYGRSNDYGKK